MPRSFRFGVNLLTSAPADEWRAKCRRAEELGYDVILVPDHLGMPAPFPALVAAAEATERPRLGTFVLNTGFWNPALLAREVATTDALTDGRLELGLGTGYVQAEHDTAELPFGSPGERVDHLLRTIEELDRLLGSPEHQPRPVQKPRVPLLIGGNGKRLLELTAEHPTSRRSAERARCRAVRRARSPRSPPRSSTNASPPTGSWRPAAPSPPN